jgi:hypothetical protein
MSDTSQVPPDTHLPPDRRPLLSMPVVLRWLAWLLVAGGAAWGVVVLFSRAPGTDRDATDFLGLEEYKLWLTLIAALTAVGVAVVPAIWAQFMRLVRLHQKVELASHPPPARLSNLSQAARACSCDEYGPCHA